MQLGCLIQDLKAQSDGFYYRKRIAKEKRDPKGVASLLSY